MSSESVGIVNATYRVEHSKSRQDTYIYVCITNFEEKKNYKEKSPLSLIFSMVINNTVTMGTSRKLMIEALILERRLASVTYQLSQVLKIRLTPIVSLLQP